MENQNTKKVLITCKQKIELKKFITKGESGTFVRGFINARLNSILNESGVSSDIYSPQYEFDVALGYLNNSAPCNIHRTINWWFNFQNKYHKRHLHWINNNTGKMTTL